MKLIGIGALLLPLYSASFGALAADAKPDPQRECAIHTNTVAAAKAARLARNFPRAIDPIVPLVKRFPECYNLNYSLGLSLAEKGQFDEALPYLKKARALKERDNINDPSIYNSLGWAHLLDSEYAEADEAFTVALSDKVWSQSSDDSRRRVLNNSGLLYIYMARYAEAEKNLKRAADEFGSALAKDNLKLLARIQTGSKPK